MRLALYVCLKNICDGVGGQDVSNGTPLDPPLFWLDNIFKLFYFSIFSYLQGWYSGKVEGCEGKDLWYFLFYRRMFNLH